jgi:hypothetical protein
MRGGAIPGVRRADAAARAAARLEPDRGAIGSVLYLGVVAAGLGFVLVVWLMRTYSASRVNVFVFLSPVFGVRDRLGGARRDGERDAGAGRGSRSLAASSS